MSVTLSEVTRAARAHRAPLAGESAGYLVLAVADQVLSAPRLVKPAEIQLAEDGGLRVLSGTASSDADAELALRKALDGLLLVASSGSAALTRASRRTSPVGLAALVRELEAALIPVNRAAARRALARLHRETTRALESGVLPADEPEHGADAETARVASPVAAAPPVPPVAAAPAPPVAAAPAPPVAAAPAPPVAVAPAPPVAIAPAPPVAAAPAPRAEPMQPTAACLPEPASPSVVLVYDSDPRMPDVRVATALSADLPLLPQWDAMLTALCQEAPERSRDADEQVEVHEDALTLVLEARAVAAVEPAMLYDEDVEFDEDVELDEPVELDETERENDAGSGDALTLLRDAPVAPVPLNFEAQPSLGEPRVETETETGSGEPPVEACTRPEPVMLRKATRPVTVEVAELTEFAPPVGEMQALTPALGSLLSYLPVLTAEQRSHLAEAAEREPSAAPLAVQPAVEAPEERNSVLSSAGDAVGELPVTSAERSEPTERTPEVLPLPPSVAIVASRKSEVSELVQSFQVAESDSTPGLRRAIKEMADLDLTPAPFATLIR